MSEKQIAEEMLPESLVAEIEEKLSLVSSEGFLSLLRGEVGND